MNIKEEKKRLFYIDLIKTVAIFFVVYCHYPVIGESLQGNLSMLFATTSAVPLLLLSHGALLLSNNGFSLKKHLKKTGFLFVASVCWKIVYLGIILRRNPVSIKELNAHTLFYYFCGQNLEQPFVPAEHFWFIYTLIGIYLLIPLIRPIFDRNKNIVKYLVLVLFVYVFVFAEFNVLIGYICTRLGKQPVELTVFRNYTFPFAQGGDMLLFLLLGGILHEKLYASEKLEKCRWKYFTVGIIGYLLLLLQKISQEGKITGEWVRLNYDYQRIPTLIMSIGLFLFFMSFHEPQKQKISLMLRFFSERTINVYYVHMLICALYIWDIYPFIPQEGVLLHTIKTMVIFLSAIAVTEPMRYVPVLSILMGVKPRR